MHVVPVLTKSIKNCTALSAFEFIRITAAAGLFQHFRVQFLYLVMIAFHFASSVLFSLLDEGCRQEKGFSYIYTQHIRHLAVYSLQDEEIGSLRSSLVTETERVDQQMRGGD